MWAQKDKCTFITHVCHLHLPTCNTLNSDFNEQVLGRETKGTEQLISPDCRQSFYSELDVREGWRDKLPPTVGSAVKLNYKSLITSHFYKCVALI